MHEETSLSTSEGIFLRWVSEEGWWAILTREEGGEGSRESGLTMDGAREVSTSRGWRGGEGRLFASEEVGFDSLKDFLLLTIIHSPNGF